MKTHLIFSFQEIYLELLKEYVRVGLIILVIDFFLSRFHYYFDLYRFSESELLKQNISTKKKKQRTISSASQGLSRATSVFGGRPAGASGTSAVIFDEKNITIICIVSAKKFGTKLQEINAYCLKLIILTIYTIDQTQLLQWIVSKG